MNRLRLPQALREKYEPIKVLGKGLQGHVLLVRTPEDEQLALKATWAPLARRERRVLERAAARAEDGFADDARALEAMPRLHDVHFGPVRGYLVQSLGPGSAESLAGRLPEADAVVFMERLTNAVRLLAADGIFHRDIQLKNILLDLAEPAQPLLIDFGCAERADANGQWTGHPNPGDARLRPPEVHPRRKSTLDVRTELYTLAALTALLVTGEPPFPGDERAAAEARRRPPPLTGIQDPGLRAVLQKAMAYAPEARYQSPEELLQALRALAPSEAAPTDVVEHR